MGYLRITEVEWRLLVDVVDCTLGCAFRHDDPAGHAMELDFPYKAATDALVLHGLAEMVVVGKFATRSGEQEWGPLVATPLGRRVRADSPLLTPGGFRIWWDSPPSGAEAS